MFNSRNVLTIFFLYFFVSCFSQSAKQNLAFKSEGNPVVLSVSFNPRNSITFNSLNGNPITFKNYSSGDSTVSKTLTIYKPTHLFFSKVTVTNTGDISEYGSILLLPGDSIRLDDNGHNVAYSTSFQKYVDSFIKVPSFCYDPNTIKINKMFKTIGLRVMLYNAKQRFEENEIRAASASLNERLKNIIHNFNYISYANEVSWFSFFKIISQNKLLLDSVYNDILQNIGKIESINSIFSINIYDRLINYSAYKKGVNSTDLWDVFNDVDSSIYTSTFYQPYLISSLRATYKNIPDRIPFIAAKLKSIRHLTRTEDTLLHLAKILLKTKEDYAAAKQELNQYVGGRFSALLDENDDEHHQQRSIQTLSPVTLLDFNTKKTTLQDVLFDDSTDITVLDFWASWCVPCVADYPYLKKTEDALKNRRIKFISLSIDREEDNDKWTSRIKELKTFNQPYQYRLQDAEHSAVIPYFNLSTIPRYIVIDKNGEILSEDFDRPNDAAFQRKLTVWLSRYK